MTNRDRAAYVARVTTHDEFIVPRREMLYRKKNFASHFRKREAQRSAGRLAFIGPLSANAAHAASILAYFCNAPFPNLLP